MAAQRIARRLTQHALAHNEYISSKRLFAMSAALVCTANNPISGLAAIPGVIVSMGLMFSERKDRLYKVDWSDMRLLQRPSLLEIAAALDRCDGDETRAEEVLLDHMIPNRTLRMDE